MAEGGGKGMEKKTKGLEGRRERTGSENSTLEMWMKRKRDSEEGKEGEGEGEWVFAKNRKTVRSPKEEIGGRGKGEVGGKEDMGKGGIREELEKARKEMGMYVEKVKKMEKELEEWKRREEMLRVEGERMKEKMRELEKRMEEREKKERGEVSKEGEAESKWEGRLRVIEKRIEGKEREDRRRRNMIIKGVSREKGDWRWGVEKIMKEIGADVRISEMRKINTGREDKGEMVWVRLEKEEDKRQVWDKKRRLKGRKVWIEEDLSWKEREVRRRLGVIAAGERRKGRNAWVEEDRIKMEGVWWRWEEEKGSLIKIMRREEQGEKEKRTGEGMGGERGRYG